MSLGWNQLLDLNQIGSQNLGWDFYAKITLGMKDLGLKQDKVYVRRKIVTFTSDTLNQLLGIPPVPNPEFYL